MTNLGDDNTWSRTVNKQTIKKKKKVEGGRVPKRTRGHATKPGKPQKKLQKEKAADHATGKFGQGKSRRNRGAPWAI